MNRRRQPPLGTINAGVPDLAAIAAQKAAQARQPQKHHTSFVNNGNAHPVVMPPVLDMMEATNEAGETGRIPVARTRVIGGLSKLEYLSGLVAGRERHGTGVEVTPTVATQQPYEQFVERRAAHAVDLAEAILAECAAREKAKAELDAEQLADAEEDGSDTDAFDAPGKQPSDA